MSEDPPSESEHDLLAALADSGVDQKDFVARLEETAPEGRFELKEHWMALAVNSNLEDWRRLAASRVLVEYAISFPINKRAFLDQVVLPMEIREDQIIELAVAQALPFDRVEGERVLMANLPIRTSVGPAAVYFAVDSSNQVQRAAVYP
jgi:hypothetical protein